MPKRIKTKKFFSKQRVRRAAPKPKESETSIVVAAPTERPWQIQGEELTILKNAICKGATDVELQYCITVARRYKLDPFKRQIWFVPRWDASADNGKGGKGANVYTPQVGIDGLLFMAARDHKDDYGSIGEPEFGPMAAHGTVMAPEWARVRVFKKGVAEPTSKTARWDEYAPDTEKKNQFGNFVAPFWRKMPHRMLSKCATALAIREAYPDLGGVYIPEECERMAEDHTPAGRQIIENVPMGGSHEAAQAVAARKIAEAQQTTAQAQNVQESPAEPQPDPSWPLITIDFSASLASPVVTGDVEAFKPLFEKHCKWGTDGFWHTTQPGAIAIELLARTMRFRVEQVFPKRPLPSEESGTARGKASTGAQTKAVPQNSRKEEHKGTPPAGAAREEKAPSGAAPFLVSGTFEKIVPKDKRVDIYWRNPVSKTAGWITSWDKKHFEHLIAGKDAEIYVVQREKNGKTFINLVGLKRVGITEFDEDGFTTVIQQSKREAGNGKLF